MINFIKTIIAIIKFTAFWGVVFAFLIIGLFVASGSRAGVGMLKICMKIQMAIVGLRVRKFGELSKNRPLLVVSNHISIFEFVSFPIAFGGSFFGKKEIEKIPIVGLVSKKFGVVFVDRSPTNAMQALDAVKKTMATVKYPMFIFPEGTTTSGTYVLPFKSTLFNFVENTNITIQPVAMFYRYKNGAPIPDQILADDYAYFDNNKMTQPPYAKRERSWASQLFHIMKIGGFMVEMHVLPAPSLAGMNRKEIAATLHKMVNDKFIESKDKNSCQKQQ